MAAPACALLGNAPSIHLDYAVHCSTLPDFRIRRRSRKIKECGAKLARVAQEIE
jgi:hypothetical protein